MKSRVYFSESDIGSVFDSVESKIEGKVGLKVHFGEAGNKTYLNPEYAKNIFQRLNKNADDVSLIECNVLYRGSRTNSTDHIKTAHDHGFGFAPIDILDGEKGDESLEVGVSKSNFFDIVYLGKGLQKYDQIVTLSHFKGHGASGFGGALKNLGMGLGSRQGKMAMHAAFDLSIDQAKCVACGICAEKCDANAIVIDRELERADIDFDKCIRCAGCIANCPQGAVEIPFGAASAEELQERIVDYCQGVINSFETPLYVNVLENITDRCDCYGGVMEPIAEDIGFVAGDDPVAVDQASFDLLYKSVGRDLFMEIHGIDATHQLEYADKIGLGSRKYEMIDV